MGGGGGGEAFEFAHTTYFKVCCQSVCACVCMCVCVHATHTLYASHEGYR